MISCFLPVCHSCSRQSEYSSRTTPPHLLAQKDGWHVRGKTWVCRECYNKEHGLGEENAQKETPKQMLDRLLADAKAKAGD